MKAILTKTALVIAAASAVAACAALPKQEVVTHITIPAEAEKVWAVLTDGPGYAEWNPFIVAMEGEVKVGERLTNTMQPTGGNAMTFKPELLVVRPEEELRWIGRLLIPGIFDGEHYFLLEEINGQTQLTHGERFSGVGLWAIDVSQFEANFAAMNEALAARVIALNTP